MEGMAESKTRTLSSSTLTPNEAKHLHESIEFFMHEDDYESAHISANQSTFLERLGEFILSRETNSVLRGIRRLLLAFGQGLEMTNANLLSGILTLEKFYLNLNTQRTGRLVRDLSKIEIPRHFWKFAMATYGWRGLNFFGKGGGIIRGII
jgi:hypothetical protein